VVELPKIGFGFTTGELFWLAALPGLSGAGLRLAYSFVVPIFGGRNFTVFSTATLLLPALWMALAVQDPGTNYIVFVVIALLCGLGGGNFSASMANISFFFPKRMQGAALGWNAGAGNLKPANPGRSAVRVPGCLACRKSPASRPGSVSLELPQSIKEVLCQRTAWSPGRSRTCTSWTRASPRSKGMPRGSSGRIFILAVEASPMTSGGWKAQASLPKSPRYGRRAMPSGTDCVLNVAPSRPE